MDEKQKQVDDIVGGDCESLKADTLCEIGQVLELFWLKHDMLSSLMLSLYLESYKNWNFEGLKCSLACSSFGVVD